MSGLLFLLVLALGAVGPLLTILAIVLWKGIWRWLACVPPALMTAYCVKVGVDLVRDTTSHNLLPIELIILYAPASLYIGLLAAARWWATGRQPLQAAG